MASLTEVELLAVWEAGLDRDPTIRALVLAGAACDLDQFALAQLSLGERDAVLFELRERCFGLRLTSEVLCPACSEWLEIELTTSSLRVEPAAVELQARVTVGGVEATFRPLTSADLLAVAEPSGDRRRDLVSGCVLQASDDLSDELIDAIAAEMSGADPQADVELSLSCDCCGHQWLESFDIGSYLWIEVDAYARRLLFEIHTLARAYGWSEADVLSVSPVRRRFYLEAVPA